MAQPDLQTLSDTALWTRHATALAAYSEARAMPGGSEYMPYLQAELAEINREIARRAGA